jgi:hypothetical protein
VVKVSRGKLDGCSNMNSRNGCSNPTLYDVVWNDGGVHRVIYCGEKSGSERFKDIRQQAKAETARTDQPERILTMSGRAEWKAKV